MKLALVEVEELLESRLKEAGLSKFVHREQSQFLDLEDEVFVELVLTDGSALNEVEKIVRHTAAELKTKGIRLESVVRALWEVGDDVTYVGPSRTLDGSLRAASEYRGTLKSGTRECQVMVDVSEEAVRVLRLRLGGDADIGKIAQIVRSFLTRQLASGGTEYWDPLLDPRLDLDEMEMSFLLGYGPSFVELRHAIAVELEPPLLSSFLDVLSNSGIRLRDFDSVLPDLALGGAYRKGQTFVSARDLFSRLQLSEQELLRQYFRRKVEELEDRFPELKEKFPKVFS